MIRCIKISAVLIAVIMFIGALNVYAVGQTEDGLRVDYAYADDACTIPLLDENGDPYLTVTGYIGNKSSVAIPEKVEMEEKGVGYTVRYIAKRAFAQNSSISKVTVPATIVSIGEGAFADCTNMTTVILPNSITEIADDTFYGCTLLVSLTLPDTITRIGSSAFEQCSMLRTLKIPLSVAEIGSYAFLACECLVLDCSENDYALAYAKDNNLFTDFEKSPDYPIVITLIYTAILGAAVIAAEIIIRQVKKRRAEKSVAKF